MQEPTYPESLLVDLSGLGGKLKSVSKGLHEVDNI